MRLIWLCRFFSVFLLLFSLRSLVQILFAQKSLRRIARPNTRTFVSFTFCFIWCLPLPFCEQKRGNCHLTYQSVVMFSSCLACTNVVTVIVSWCFTVFLFLSFASLESETTATDKRAHKWAITWWVMCLKRQPKQSIFASNFSFFFSIFSSVASSFCLFFMCRFKLFACTTMCRISFAKCHSFLFASVKYFHFVAFDLCF